MISFYAKRSYSPVLCNKHVTLTMIQLKVQDNDELQFSSDKSTIDINYKNVDSNKIRNLRETGD